MRGHVESDAARRLDATVHIRPRDLESLIKRMAALGQVRTHGDALRFAAIATGNSAFGACQLTAAEQTVPCPNLLAREGA